jgi:hypothetical protein
MIHAVLAVCVEIPVRLEDQSISEFPLCIGYLGRKLDEMVVIHSAYLPWDAKLSHFLSSL